MASKRKQHWPEDWKQYKVPATLKREDVQHLLAWMKSMCEWGEHVRDDLIRLEGSLGIAAGDPGDPPVPPWLNGDED